MRAHHSLTCLLTCVVAASSCGWLFPLGLDSLTETRVRSICHFLYGCCTPIERTLMGNPPFSDEAACVAELLEDPSFNGIVGYGGSGEALARDAVARGAAEFDAEAAERCSRAFLDAANSCDPQPFFTESGLNTTALQLLVDATDPECVLLAGNHFTRGLVDDGAECQGPLDCAGFGTCLLEGGPDVTVTGSCEARPAEGESCLGIGMCQLGATCTFPAGSGEPTCVVPQRVANGEPCNNYDECESRYCGASEAQRCSSNDAPCIDAIDCPAGDSCGAFGGACAEAPTITVALCDGQ